ncbi:hypothetical protein HDV06_005221 [Boothiomyces sp. JEL0866]|nr:hypothetical protein HDV06_005221 [Boothiomyces sp. JEL0866]
MKEIAITCGTLQTQYFPYINCSPSSGVLEEKHKQLYFYLLNTVLLAAMGFIEASALLGVTFAESDYCVNTIDDTTNLIGKMMLMIIYFVICVVFLWKIKKKLKAKSKARTAFILGLLRVIAAVVALLISVIFSYTKVWGPRFFIQFTTENYFGIIASTFVCQIPEQRTNSQSNSTKKQELKECSSDDEKI